MYNGEQTNSDHRILAARFKLDRMFGTFGAGRKSKLERFAIEHLSVPDSVHEAYRESVSDDLARLDTSSPQTTCYSIAKIPKTAAKKTFGLRPKQVAKKGMFDSAIESVSREQKDLRLRIKNTKDEMKREELRKRREISGKSVVVSGRTDMSTTL